MSTDSPAETRKLSAGSITFVCPAAAASVGTVFTLCAKYAITLKCPYDAYVHALYLTAQNVPVPIDFGPFNPNETSGSLQHKFTLATPPRQGNPILLSAEIYKKGSVKPEDLLASGAIAVTFDANQGGDVCTAACAALK